MSSCLAFYGVKGENKPVRFLSYSRNDEIYTYFEENLSIPCSAFETKYTELTSEDVGVVIRELEKEIEAEDALISEYEKHAGGNIEIVNEIISAKKYYKQLVETKNKIETISDIVDGAMRSCNGFDKILCNIV